MYGSEELEGSDQGWYYREQGRRLHEEHRIHERVGLKAKDHAGRLYPIPCTCTTLTVTQRAKLNTPDQQVILRHSRTSLQRAKLNPIELGDVFCVKDAKPGA